VQKREAFEKLIPLWAERYGDRWVTFQELDRLAQEIGKPLLYRYARGFGGRRVVSPLYRVLEAHEGRRRVDLGDRRYSLWRRRGHECWDDAWRLVREPTDAETRAESEAYRRDLVARFVRAWAAAYDDLPATTDQLVELAVRTDWWFGRSLSQRARQVSLARAVRRLVGTVVDGWRIAEPSRSRPTKWRLVCVKTAAEAISAAS
jgi:hypothetical protein